MEEKRDEIISLIPDNADDYEKVKFLYTYLAENLSFIGCSDDGADLLSVFLNGQIDAEVMPMQCSISLKEQVYKAVS